MIRRPSCPSAIWQAAWHNSLKWQGVSWSTIARLLASLTEAIDMVADSVAYLRAEGRRVFLDAEHFFDGYKANPRFSLDVLRAAEKGADG